MDDLKQKLKRLKSASQEAMLNPNAQNMVAFLGLATPQMVLAIISTLEVSSQEIAGPEGWMATALHLVSTCEHAQIVLDGSSIDLKSSLVQSVKRLQNEIQEFKTPIKA